MPAASHLSSGDAPGPEVGDRDYRPLAIRRSNGVQAATGRSSSPAGSSTRQPREPKSVMSVFADPVSAADIRPRRVYIRPSRSERS